MLRVQGSGDEANLGHDRRRLVVLITLLTIRPGKRNRDRRRWGKGLGFRVQMNFSGFPLNMTPIQPPTPAIILQILKKNRKLKLQAPTSRVWMEGPD